MVPTTEWSTVVKWLVNNKGSREKVASSTVTGTGFACAQSFFCLSNCELLL